MGLDNGIYLRMKSPYNGELLKYFKDTFKDYDAPEYDYLEVAYWRKCWDLRREIIEVLDLRDDGHRKELTVGAKPGDGECEFEINRKEIKRILKVVKHFDNPSVWDRSNSIWTYKEIHKSHKRNKKHLKKLVEILKEHPEYTVVWIDSY